MTYSEKLKHPKWQQKRLEVLDRDGFKCVSCESSEKTLHVHHAYYVSKREPWDYPLAAFRTFCADCHDNRHDEHIDSQGKWMMWEHASGWLDTDTLSREIEDVRCRLQITGHELQEKVLLALRTISK